MTSTYLNPKRSPQTPVIVNFFEEDSKITRTSDLHNSSNFEVMENFKTSVNNLRYENEKNYFLEKTNLKLENLLTQIKMTLEIIRKEENIKLVNFLNNQSNLYLSDMQIAHLKVLIAENERESRERRRRNIVIIGSKQFDGDAVTIASEILEKYFSLRNCVVKAKLISKEKPILIVELESIDIQKEILRNRMNLRGTRIYIHPDLTVLERETQKRLKQIGSEALKLGKSVKFGYRSLRIDGLRYIWNHETNSLQPKFDEL